MVSCSRVLSKNDSTEVCKNNPWRFVSRGILGVVPTEKGNGLVPTAKGPAWYKEYKKRPNLGLNNV